MRHSFLTLATLAAIAAAPAQATSSGYSVCGIAAPTINQTNFAYSSANWASSNSPTGKALLTSVHYAISTTSSSQGTVQARLCTSSGSCNAWGGLNVTTTAFNAFLASTVFYFQVRVMSGNTVVLNPKVYSAGQSCLDTSYTT